MEKTQIAIIGAGGFIGRHLTERLQTEAGVELHLFGKSESTLPGTSLICRKLDTTQPDLLREQFRQIDYIYYLASETIPSTSWENPVMDIEKNLLPFIHFTETVSRLSVKKIIFVSSGGTVYGATDHMVDEHSFTNPFSPYGIIKLTMEHFLNYFEVKHGLHFDIYRVSNVYGEGQNTGKGIGLINTFIEKIITEKKIYIFGDGGNVRNYLYVKDLAELMLTSLRRDAKVSEIYNTASNDTLTVNDIARIMQHIVPVDFDLIYKDARQSDNSAIHLDHSKIVAANPGFRFTEIEAGILKVYEHIRYRG